MTYDSPLSRSGLAIAQPPTPLQTPTLVAFPSPVFDSPKFYQAPSNEADGLTPRFAEEFSVFNSTPGNLGGAQDPFADFVPATPASSSSSHKRRSSISTVAADAELAVIPFSPILSYRSQSGLGFPSIPSTASPVSISSTICRSPKKARLESVHPPPKPTPVLSPPPTTRKQHRRLIRTPSSMHHDAVFGPSMHKEVKLHPEMTPLMSTPGEAFAYHQLPAESALHCIWGSSAPMGLGLEYSAATSNGMPLSAPPLHRQQASFDWNADLSLFPEAALPEPLASDQQSQPQLGLAGPHKSMTFKAPDAVPGFAAAQTMASLDNSFAALHDSSVVNPGLLLSRPLMSNLDYEADYLSPSGSAEVAIAEWNRLRGSKSEEMAEHMLTSSPVKPLMRPRLERSHSDNRGTADGEPAAAWMTPCRHSRPWQTEAAAEAASTGPNKSGSRATGKLPLSETHPRMSGLASIPEGYPKERQRTLVRLRIDSNGRARAERRIARGGGPWSSRGITRSRSSRSGSTHRSWGCSDDSSSTDDEPILIPGHSRSLKASFALRQRGKESESALISSSRSTSDVSTGGGNAALEGESEAETVVDGRQDGAGDAASELRKVVEYRQRQTWRKKRGTARRQVPYGLTKTVGGIISPPSMTGSSCGRERRAVRCICPNSTAEERDGFLLQCESCEMWLHGKCINMTEGPMPRVYICSFCAELQMSQMGCRDNALGIETMRSPFVDALTTSFR